MLVHAFFLIKDVSSTTVFCSENYEVDNSYYDNILFDSSYVVIVAVGEL